MAKEDTTLDQKGSIVDLSGESEQVKINIIIGEKDNIRNNRSALEKQWYINLVFLAGHQYFSLTKTGNTLGERIWFAFDRLAKSKKQRRVSNRILVNFRSLHARMMQRKTRVVVDPETRMKRDIEAAKIADEVIEDFWKRVNMNNSFLGRKLPGMTMVQKYLYNWMLTFGRAYLHPYFNEKTKSKTLVGGNVVMAKIGEIEVKVKSPIDLFVDPVGRFVIDREIVSVAEVKDEFGKNVDPENVKLSEIEQQVMSLIQKTNFTDIKGAVELYRFYKLPDEADPKGKHIVFTSTEIIKEDDLPEELGGKLPYIEFNFFDLLMSSFSQGLVEQLVPLQREYNFTISRIAEYKKYFGGKLMVKDGANLQTKWTDETGQIIKYAGTEPKYSVPPNPPEFLFADLNRIDQNMQDVAMAHDATQGKEPGKGGKSGVAIRELQEQDNTNLAPTLLEVEAKMSMFVDMVLDMMASKYSQERILSLAGRKNEEEVKTFMGFEVKGNRRVTVNLGSSLPASKQARQEFVAALVKAGIVKPDEAKSLLQLGDVEGALDDVDERKQKFENEEMLKGIIATVKKWDEHRTHIRVTRDFMEEPVFGDLPERTQAFFISHYEEHLEQLAKELTPNPETDKEVTPTIEGEQPQGIAQT